MDQQHQQIHILVHPKIKPRRPFGSTTSTNPHHCSSLDQAPTALWINNPSTNLYHTKIESEDQIVKEIVTPKLIQNIILYTCSCLVRFRNFPCLQIWHAQWDYLYLSSLSSNPQKYKWHQERIKLFLATKAKNKSILAASGDISGITTRSKARALFAAASTAASTLLEEQEHLRHEPVITLASLRASREESPRKYYESLLSDTDSSSSTAMQVMTTRATSIEEQLAQMNEA